VKGFLNFLLANPHVVFLLIAGGWGLLVRFKKAMDANQGLGGGNIPQEAPIQTHRMASGTPAPARRIKPPQLRIRRPGRPARPNRVQPPPTLRTPPVRRPVEKDPEGPDHAMNQPVETHLEGVQTHIRSGEAAALVTSSAPSPLSVLLGGREDLRRGLILREVLGPPLALRTF